MKTPVVSGEAEAEAEAAPKADPRDSERWTFQFEYKDPRGKVWSGTFTNKILTVAEQQAANALTGRFAGGVPVEALEPGARELNAGLAHMTYSLEESAEWAKDLRALHDTSLVLSLWTKVWSHEAHYFRLIPAEDPSKAGASE